MVFLSLLGSGLLGAALTAATVWLGFQDLELALLFAPGGGTVAAMLAAAFALTPARLDEEHRPAGCTGRR